jgi:hypothetical protein
VTAVAVQDENLSVARIAIALVVPVGAVLLMIFVTWSVLMRSFDLSHVPLLLVSLVPLAAAIVVGLVAGSTGNIDLKHSSDVTALVSVIALVALGSIVEVVGHEFVGYGHTVRVLDGESADG